MKVLVDPSLGGFGQPLADIGRDIPLDISWHTPGTPLQPGRYHVVLLPYSKENEELAAQFGNRVFLVGGPPGPRSLQMVPDRQSLGTILYLCCELSSREQQVADSRALLADLALMTRLTGFEEKLELVAHTCRAVTHSKCGRVVLIEGDGRFTAPGPDGRLKSIDIQEDSVLQDVVRLKTARVLPREDCLTDPFIRRMMPSGAPAYAISVCLVSEGRPVGLLVVCRDDGEPAYSEDDLSQAMIVGGAAAIAIDNLRLYKEARESYDRLIATQKQLLQVEKLSSLGQLSAGIAHEINNPLFVIMGNLELAIERIDGKLKGYLQRALSNAERIKRIVLDLREFYAPSRNVFIDLDINRILENAIPIVSLQTQAGNIRFNLKLGTNLPAVQGDDNQLLQVFTNLLLNAIQAMPDGGTVTLESRRLGNRVVVSVADTGVGIPEEHISRVFDPFFTTKRDWTGTGLGLSVTHTIVENHHGTIEVESRVNRGTTFRVILPAAPNPPPRPEPPPVAEALQEPPPNLRILVVDDDEMIREYIQTVLTEHGVGSDGAGDAEEALTKARATRYDLILLDNKMPGRSGLDAVSDIRSNVPWAKVVLLTGTVTLHDDDVRQLGFYSMLRKPCSSADILALIRRAAGE